MVSIGIKATSDAGRQDGGTLVSGKRVDKGWCNARTSRTESVACSGVVSGGALYLEANSGYCEWLSEHHTLLEALLMESEAPPGVVRTFRILVDPVHADRTARMVSRASRISVFACALLLLSCSDYQTHIPAESPACPLHVKPDLDPRPGPPK